MNLDRAKQLSKGDYVMSPYTSPPCEALRVTEVNESASGKYLYIRVHKLAGITQMAGGWCDATAFEPAPVGWHWNMHGACYEKRVKNRDGTYTVTERKMGRDLALEIRAKGAAHG